jgi:hypothetical protein
MIEDKVELSRARAELVEILATLLPPEERVRIQGELSVINARIKALNTTAAAQLKAAADRRKVAGLAEAQANAARARGRVNGGVPAEPDDTDDDPGQTATIDAWITVVLQDSGIKVRRKRDGLDFVDVPAKWLVVLQRLRAGIHAAARGQELPDVEAEPEPPKPEPPGPPKTKKR